MIGLGLFSSSCAYIEKVPGTLDVATTHIKIAIPFAPKETPVFGDAAINSFAKKSSYPLFSFHGGYCLFDLQTYELIWFTSGLLYTFTNNNRVIMRYGRAKHARKTLQFFQRSLGLTAPYHIILDGTFLVAMLTQKVPLRDRLDRTLQHGKFTLYVTRSALKELEKLADLAPQNKEIFQQARQWGLDETDEILEIVPKADIDNDQLGEPGKDVLKHVATHPGYIVASQDETLLDILRSNGSAPLLRLSRGVLLLENPSKASMQQASFVEKKKWTVAGSVTKQETALVDAVRDEQRIIRPKQSDYSQRRVSKKPSGPNPLSCKSKKRTTNDEAVGENKRKRRRKAKSGEV